MKIGSQSTTTAGYSFANRSRHFQCVVALRPSSNPASASRIVPLHTDATRRAEAPAVATQSTRARSDRALDTPSPPATTNVSIPRGSVVVTDRSGLTDSPLLERTGPVFAATTTHSYSAWRNTSNGPLRSSDW